MKEDTAEKRLWEAFEAITKDAVVTLIDLREKQAEIATAFEKVVRKLNRVTESRDSWEAKYKLRNDDAKDYAKTITKLQKELARTISNTHKKDERRATPEAIRKKSYGGENDTS